jgi:hypothetical protein
MKRIFLLTPFIFVAIAQAGPYDQPYGIVAPDTLRSADPLVRRVIVNRVDGENSVRREHVVPPGMRAVTLDLPPRKGFHLATQVTFDLEVKPCTRYYVAAKLETEVTQGWTPIVRSEEAIGECKAKFKIG